MDPLAALSGLGVTKLLQKAHRGRLRDQKSTEKQVALPRISFHSWPRIGTYQGVAGASGENDSIVSSHRLRPAPLEHRERPSRGRDGLDRTGNGMSFRVRTHDEPTIQACQQIVSRARRGRQFFLINPWRYPPQPTLRAPVRLAVRQSAAAPVRALKASVWGRLTPRVQKLRFEFVYDKPPERLGKGLDGDILSDVVADRLDHSRMVQRDAAGTGQRSSTFPSQAGKPKSSKWVLPSRTVCWRLPTRFKEQRSTGEREIA